MDLKRCSFNMVSFYLRKGQASYFSPEEIDTALNRAQIEYFEQIKPAFSANQQVSDALKPFRKKYPFTTSDTVSGVITLPDDYFHLLALSVTVVDAQSTTRYIGVEMVGDDQLDDRRDSQLIPVNTYNPIAVFDEGGTIQLYPSVPFSGTMRYLRKPLEAQFVYTTSGRTIRYVEGSSTQLEWNEPSINKIIFKALETLGVNTQDLNTVSFAQAKDQP
jgi:hypothetical protein